MLNSILIKNIVLIDQLKIDLADNFCVLTGETGSGKSILLDALGLAIGYRLNNRLLKKDAQEGLVVAEFDISNNPFCQEILQENGLINCEDPNLLILRRILKEGGSKAFVNDIAIGVNLLNKIGQSLVEIHGQNEQSNLLNPAFHRVILDQYANHQSLLQKIANLFEQLSEIKNKLQKLNDEKEQNEREKDYLKYTIKELQEANIEENEEEQLVEKRNLILNYEKVNNVINEILLQINDADSKVISAIRTLTRNSNLENLANDKNNNLEKLNEILDQIAVKNDNAKNIIEEIKDSFDIDNLNLEVIEERLFLIKSLARKFNINSNDLPAFLQQCQDKLEIVENFDIVADDLQKQKVDLEEQYLTNAKELSNLRKSAAKKLTKEVEKELAFLKMPSVKFAVNITNLSEENYNKNGIDSIRFAAATNAGSNLDDISKIASGGELSRFMLALKVALLEVKSVPILIFDEIDAGIGGAVADAVGNRLKLLAKNLQILVVTHHPQIAAKANFHLKVQKINKENITTTKVEKLSKDQTKQEIARMLSGKEISSEALAAAEKLME